MTTIKQAQEKAVKDFNEMFENNISLDDAMQKSYTQLHLLPALRKFVENLVAQTIKEERDRFIKIIGKRRDD